MDSELMLASLWTAGAIALLAIAGLAWRGRQRGVEPRCKACGYDLRGRAVGANRCPECGTDLLTLKAVQVGVRQRHGRRAMAFSAAALAAGAFAARHGWHWAEHFDWLPYEPTGRVLSQAKGPTTTASAAAARELLSRLDRDALSPKQESEITTEALRQQAGTAVWMEQWGWMLETLHAKRRLPDADWQLYAGRFVTLEVQVPPTVEAGRPPSLKVKSVFNPRRGRAKVRGDWEATRVQIDGVSVPYIASGSYDIEGSSSSQGEAFSALQARLPTGNHLVHVTATIAWWASTASGTTTRPSDLKHETRDLTTTLCVIAPEAVSAAKMAALRDPMHAAVTVTATHKAGEPGEVKVHSKNLPMAIAASLTVCRPGTTEPLVDGDTGWKFVLPTTEQIYTLPLPEGAPLTVDIVMKPDGSLGGETTHVGPYWPETINFRDVRVSQLPASTEPAARP